MTVVTSAHDGGARGITIGSLVSTSLEPALVSFNVSRDSPMAEMLKDAGEFVVHVLGASQVDLSEHFAEPGLSGEAQFGGVSHSLSEGGMPLIDGVLARLLCCVDAIHEAGDHLIVVGLVYRVQEGEPGEPLLYYDRGYRSVDDPVGG